MTVAIQRNGQRYADTIKSLHRLPLGPNGSATIAEVTMSLRKRPGTDNWMLEFTLPDGRRVRKTSGTSDRAEAKKRERQLKMELGAVFDISGESPAFKPVPIEDVQQAFLAVQRPETVKSYHGPALDPFVTWIGPERDISTVKLKDLQAYQVHKLNDRSTLNGSGQVRRCSAANVNKITNVLKTFFRFAVDHDFLRESPASKLKHVFNPEPDHVERFLDSEEKQHLLDNCPAPLRQIVTVALGTGLRRLELMRLAKRNLNFAEEKITVTGSKVSNKKHLPMLPQLKEVLLELSKHVASDTEPLFKSADGVPWTANAIRLSFDRARKRAKIQVRFHDLRHTFASDAVFAGVPLPVLAQWLGHSTVKMTEKYAHVRDELSRQEARRMSKHLEERKAA